MNFTSLASFGLGLEKGRSAAEDKKKRDRQQLLALTQRALQMQQSEQDRASARQDAKDRYDQSLGERRKMDDERRKMDDERRKMDDERRKMDDERRKMDGFRQTSAADIAQARKDALDARTAAGTAKLTTTTLRDYINSVGTGRMANLTGPQQRSAVQGLNSAGGTTLPVPGDVNGSRPLNYGLPPAQAAQINDAISGITGAVTGAPAMPPSALTSVPYFDATPDQVVKRAATVAGTANKAAGTAAIPARLTETHRHNVASEGTAVGGLKERTTHDRNAEALGTNNFQERGRHDQVIEGQGNQRIQQGHQRITIAQLRALQSRQAAKGQPTFKDFQGIIEKNNAQKNKILAGAQVWNKDKSRYDALDLTPNEKNIVDRADYNIRQAQHGQRAVGQGVSPITGQPAGNGQPSGKHLLYPVSSGTQIVPLRGGGSARIPAAPPLPSGLPPHHSHAQPRRTTGEFKPAKIHPSSTKAALARLRAMGIE